MEKVNWVIVDMNGNFHGSIHDSLASAGDLLLRLQKENPDSGPYRIEPCIIGSDEIRVAKRLTPASA